MRRLISIDFVFSILACTKPTSGAERKTFSFHVETDGTRLQRTVAALADWKQFAAWLSATAEDNRPVLPKRRLCRSLCSPNQRISQQFYVFNRITMNSTFGGNQNMKRLIFIVFLSIQAACTTPDVSNELDAANALALETGKTLHKWLAPKAKAEFQTAEMALIRNSNTVLSLDGTCDISAARGAGLARTDCTLVDWVKPGDGPVSATSALEAIDVIQAYFAALKDLSETSAPGDIASKTEALLVALEETGSVQKKSLQRLAASAAENKGVIVKVVGFASEQYRTSRLRSVVRKGDPLVRKMTRIASAYLDNDVDPSLLKAQQALTNSREELLNAQESGDPGRYRQSIANIRIAFEQFKAAEARASAAGLLTLSQLHGDLLARLNGAGSAAEVQATLNDIFEITELIKGKDK